MNNKFVNTLKSLRDKLPKRAKYASDEERRKVLFGEMPIWKSVIINALPMMISMLVFGIYAFVDSILAVNLAPDAYANTPTAQIMGAKDYIRLAMNAGGPITMFMQAIVLLFGVGISTRVSINIGAKRMDRACNSIKTGSQVGMITMLVLIPILIFSATPWMESQYPPAKFGTVTHDGYKYISIMIFALPMQFVGQVLSGLFRVDGRLRSMTFAMTFPIAINLLFDYVFMGAMHMGIEGGAWATFISTGLTPAILIVFAFFKKSDLIRLKNIVGKFHWISIVGIVLVGSGAFLRNFANAVTQTTQFQVIQDVSSHIFNSQTIDYTHTIMNSYLGASPGAHSEDFRVINAAYVKFAEQYPQMHLVGLKGNLDIVSQDVQTFLHSKVPPELVQKMHLPSGTEFSVLFESVLVRIKAGSFMSIFASGAFPIYMLFFPSMFGIVTGVGPLAGYNYGAKKFKRVKQSFYWTILYAFMWGTFLYVLGAFALAGPLLTALGVSDEVVPGFGKSVMDYSKTLLVILMIGIPLYGMAVAGIIVLTSTDRIFLSIIASGLRGFVFFFPLLYGFQAIANHNPDTWWIFWIFSPLSILLTSITIFIIVIFVLERLAKKHVTLDDKIQKVHKWADNRRKERKLRRAKWRQA